MENLDSIIKDISNKQANITASRIELIIKKALNLIPGYGENIRIITSLKTYLENIKKIESQLFDVEMQKELNIIQTYIAENLPRVKLK